VCRKVFDVSQFKVTLTVTNNFLARSSNAVELNDDQVINVLDIFDIQFDAEEDTDLDSILRDFGMSLADLDAAILDTERGTEV